MSFSLGWYFLHSSPSIILMPGTKRQQLSAPYFVCSCKCQHFRTVIVSSSEHDTQLWLYMALEENKIIWEFYHGRILLSHFNSSSHVTSPSAHHYQLSKCLRRSHREADVHVVRICCKLQFFIERMSRRNLNILGISGFDFFLWKKTWKELFQERSSHEAWSSCHVTTRTVIRFISWWCWYQACLCIQVFIKFIRNQSTLYRNRAVCC